MNNMLHIQQPHFSNSSSLVVENSAQKNEISECISRNIEGSSLKRSYGKEVTWNLPLDQSTKFPG